MIFVLNWITIGWAALLLSSMVSMMAVFMGSGSSDLQGLLLLQLWLIPLQCLALAAYLWRAQSLSSGLPALWRHTPGWLVFILCSALSLVLISELSFVLVSMLAETPRPWQEHIPAVTAFLSAFALAAAYAHLQLEQGVRNE